MLPALCILAMACAGGEVPPDIEHPELHQGPGFKMKYPGNWHFKSQGEDPGEFRLESPGEQCSITFDVDRPAGNFKKKLRANTARRALAMPEPKFKAVKEWGSHNGHGMLFMGRMTTMATVTGYTLVFAFVEGNSAAHVTETCLDEFRETSAPGFDYIARNFHLF
jgi:hypothetical protein